MQLSSTDHEKTSRFFHINSASLCETTDWTVYGGAAALIELRLPVCPCSRRLGLVSAFSCLWKMKWNIKLQNNVTRRPSERGRVLQFTALLTIHMKYAWYANSLDIQDTQERKTPQAVFPRVSLHYSWIILLWVLVKSRKTPSPWQTRYKYDTITYTHLPGHAALYIKKTCFIFSTRVVKADTNIEDINTQTLKTITPVFFMYSTNQNRRVEYNKRR